METIRQLCYGIGIGIASAWSQQVRAHCHSSMFPLCLMPGEVSHSSRQLLTTKKTLGIFEVVKAPSAKLL
jgi:hypothetical protein